MVLENRFSSFTARRVNTATFVIVEDDSYGERPLIYARLFDEPPVLLLCDTGCDSPSKRCMNARFIHLRDFLEHCPVPELDEPINLGGRRTYAVVMSHCHYDHIGGINQFRSSTSPSGQCDVVASHTGSKFIRNNLWEHSLCKVLGLPKPDYHPNVWAQDHSRLFFHGGSVHALPPEKTSQANDLGYYDLAVTVINTPGHTPDQLAWYDCKKRHLFVGDSLYYTGSEEPFPGSYAGPIILPKEGNLVDYMQSLRKLLTFVIAENTRAEAQGDRRLRIGCGHVNSDEDAYEMLQNVITFVEKILEHKIPISKRQIIRGEENWTFAGKVMLREIGPKEIGLRAPATLFWDYESHMRGRRLTAAMEVS